MFNETILPWNNSSNLYGLSVLNPDGSLLSGGSLYQVKQYIDDSDATHKYTYVCESITGKQLTDSEWRIRRLKERKDTGDLVSVSWADNTTYFNKSAADLTTVQNYSYLID